MQLRAHSPYQKLRMFVLCRLVDEYPEHVVSWFAVGCYYQSVGRFDSARQYFGKATTMDASFAPGWLGFGHAFAAQDESDQVQKTYPVNSTQLRRYYHVCKLFLCGVSVRSCSLKLFVTSSHI